MLLLKLVYLIFGYSIVRVRGDNPLKFVNLMYNIGLHFFGLEKLSEGEYQFKLPSRYTDTETLDILAEKSRQKYHIYGRRGIGAYIAKYKARAGLFTGGALGLILLYTSTFFIWEVNIPGDARIAEEIAYELASLGCKPGQFIRNIDASAVAERMMLADGRLLWISVNIKGTVANVGYRLRTEEPPTPDLKTPVNVVAAKAGIIVHMEVYEGQEVKKTGDVVNEGDVIISGVIDSTTEGFRIKHAMGKVLARTLRRVEIRIPLLQVVREYTGNSVRATSFGMLGKNFLLPFGGKHGYEMYERIDDMGNIILFEAVVLPLTMTVREYREYRTREVLIPEDEAIDRAIMKLHEIINNGLGDVEIVGYEYTTMNDNEVLILQCDVECIEDICRSVEFQSNKFER